MGAGGSISAMLTSLKNNRIPKSKKKTGGLEYVKSVPIGEPLKFKNTLSTTEMAELKALLQRQKKRNRRISILVYFIFLSAALAFLFYIFN